MTTVYTDRPWSSLGTTIADSQITSSEEAIKAANLDFNVVLQDVAVGGILTPQYKGVVRETDNKLYHIAKTRFEPTHHSKAFKSFDPIVTENFATYDTVGNLKDGAKAWLLAKLKDVLSIKGEEIAKYICLVNSHDGSSALKIFFTPIRVVCTNTLTMAEAHSKVKFYAKHTKNADIKLVSTPAFIEVSNKFFSEFSQKANILADKPMTISDLDSFVDMLFKTSREKRDEIDGIDTTQEEYRSREADKEIVRQLFDTGRGLDNPDIKHTRWAAYNALVEFVDYDREPRMTKNMTADDARLNSVWFGSGAALKSTAWDYLLRN